MNEIEKAIEHFHYGITHDIFSEPVTTYARLAIDALREKAEREKGGRAMRIDLLERWLKAYPYGYCDGMNFQTCRANENTECPYCASNVHCSEGNAAIDYYREMLRYMRLKPWQARKRTLMFAETLPSIMRSLDRELAKRNKFPQTDLMRKEE